ncbi:MAG: hypothetical protein ACRDT0_22780 [Pseudonocardiaceae bacterium]
MVLFVASCIGQSEGIPLEEDVRLSSQLQELRSTGGSRPLKELASGNWDAVYIFPDDGITRDYVETKVGQSIDMPTLPSYQNIVVFMDGAEVVRAVNIQPPQLYPVDPFRYSSAVQVVAPRPGVATCDLVEPAQPVPSAL